MSLRTLHKTSTVKSRSSDRQRSHVTLPNNGSALSRHSEPPCATATWRQHLAPVISNGQHRHHQHSGSALSTSANTVTSESAGGTTGTSSGGSAPSGSSGVSVWDDLSPSSAAGGVGVGANGESGEQHCSSLLTNNNDIVMPEYIVDASTRTTYLKGKFLGKGGFARVHELTDLTTNRVYAGKIIAKSHITKPHHKEKIAREVELHRTLKHKHIVQFRHFFEDENNVYIILENCPRKSLVHVLKERINLTEPEVRYYMLQLVEGVQYIHSQKVIHRDLKLGNMFLTDDMVMKIGDFGLATEIDTIDGGKNASICGTPNYIAPEVLNKEGLGFEADIWAMGCIMYAMLVGQPPFETATLKDTYVRIITNDYTIPPLIDMFARALITDMLHQSPAHRPSLNMIREYDFFYSGYLPPTLSSSCCTSVPKFPASVSPPPLLLGDRRSPSGGSGGDRSSPVYQISCPALLPPPPPSSSMSQIVATDMPPRLNSMSQRPLPAPPSFSNELHKLTNAMTQMRVKPLKLHVESNRGGVDRNHSSAGKNKKEKEQSFQSSIRHKITSVLCPDKSLSQKKAKACSASTLYHVLGACLDNMPDVISVADDASVSQSSNILFVTKWIDYSNKYGFGFQLSDYSVGVLFNDSTKMELTSDKSRVEFLDLSGKLTAISVNNIPTALEERFTLLCYFAQYMDEHLTEGGDTKGSDWLKRKNPMPYMKRWLRTTRAIIMQLSTGALQINFFKDHTKIILTVEKNEYLVTYINQERRACTYKLLHITNNGCSVHIRERLLYALNVLKEFASLDGDFDDS